MGNNTIYSPFHSERGRGWGFLSRDRRWHLSLLCGILLDRKNHSNRLQLGAPPLGGGWVGFPDEGVCPYRLTLSLIKETPSSLWRGRFFVSRRGSPYIKETPSLFANNAIYAPLHSERGRGWGCRWLGVRLLYYNTGTVTPDREDCFLSLSCSKITMSFLPFLR